MSHINTIIFDLGKVLINWDPKHLYHKIFRDEDKMNWFLKNICDPDWNEEQDAGRTIAEATELKVNEFPEYRSEIEAFYGRWEEMLNGPIQGSVEILASLKKKPGYKIYALTNWSSETFPIAIQQFQFLKWFDGIVVSGIEKTRKPFPEIYNILIDRYQIDPSKSIFIDDSLRNIKAGEQLGITGIHFSTPELLQSELLNRKIL